jgi:hypothetical protein
LQLAPRPEALRHVGRTPSYDVPPTTISSLAATYEHPATIRVGVLTALRRHWFAALVPVVVLVSVATVVGLKRTPHYTATANVAIGPVFITNPAGISSVLQGTSSLASVYSRVIDADAVIGGTERRMPGRALPKAAALSATPVPDSPMITVKAVAASGTGAVGLANAASAALAEYVNRQQGSEEAAAAISELYEKAALRYRQRLDVSKRLDERYDAEPTQANKQERDRAAAAADTALLHRNALLTSYQDAVMGGSSTPSLKVFATATEASTDRYTTLEILVFVALIGGLFAGAALALLLAQREARPRHTP